MSLTSLLAEIFHRASSPSTSSFAPPPPPPHASAASTSVSNSTSASISSAVLEDPALSLLRLIRQTQSLADSLSLYSENDTLEDLPTGTLRALLLHSIWAETEANVRTNRDPRARRQRLETSRSHYVAYARTLFELGVLPRSSSNSSSSSSSSRDSGPVNLNAPPMEVVAGLLRPLTSSSSSSSSSTGPAIAPSNPNQRRELKVALFKLERAFKNALDEYRHAAREKAGITSGGGLSVPGAGMTTGSSMPTSTEPEEPQYDVLILPSRRQRGGQGDARDEAEDDEDEEEEDEAFVAGSSSGNGQGVNGSASKNSSSSSGSGAITTPTNLRSYLLLLLRFHALLAYNALSSMDDELKLLSNISAAEEKDARERQAREEADMERRRGAGGDDDDDFRLERRFDADAPGPLMDNKGKPLRPFTITSGSLSSSTAASQANATLGGAPVHDLDERRRLREGVFRPGHRLPTMSIDEFLEEEDRRGNIIRGGGAAGAAQATPREARTLRTEYDGSRAGEEALEEERREKMEWDDFKESNRRGAGNTMNRG